MKNKLILFLLLCIGFHVSSVYAQSSGESSSVSERPDYDAYYYSPLSVSAFYQPLSGMGNSVLADFSISEIAGEVRFSFRKVPRLQPLVRGGVVTYSFVGDLEESLQDWSHYHVFGGAGAGYSVRLSREFELGGDIFCGVTQSWFPNLVLSGEVQPQGQLNILGGASARIALNPSYNISIAVTPSVQYVHGLGPLDTHNGFVFGVGFGASYRVGRDPDAAQTDIRAIRFTDTELPPFFAAMQSYYADNPAGSIAVKNGESYAVKDVSFSFMQPGFMDSPTPIARMESLDPEQTAEVPVRAIFNDQVFTTQGVTPLTGEIIVQYNARGRQVEQRQSVTYDLYDRNALTWDDDRKAAAFVTPQDSAVRNYASYIRQEHRDVTNEYLCRNLQFAMQAYNALAELGILYQIDPTSPFTEVQEDSVVVDSISLPRETLVRRTGDCDDLSVLYNTLLQTVGIPTAFVTTPGHIFSAFSTGLSAKDAEMIHPDRSMMLDIDGELWVLVEITMIGRSSFMDAWRTAASEFAAYDGKTRSRGFYPTAEAQELYRPVSLRETDLGLQYGDAGRMVETFKNDLDRLTGNLLEPLAGKARESNSTRDWNKYGIAAAKLGDSRRALEAFRTVLRLDPDHLTSQLNMGSLYFLMGEFSQALTAFSTAEQIINNRQIGRESILLNLYINMGKTYYTLENFDKANSYYKKAVVLSPGFAGKYSYLGTDRPDSSTLASDETVQDDVPTARASEAVKEEPVLFFDE